MSNIYEALEQAQREKNSPDIQPMISIPDENKEKSTAPRRPSPGNVGIKAASPAMDEEMLTLYQSIESLLPDTPQKTILFTGPQGGEGVSTIVREFARITTARLFKSVLIMDAAHHNPSLHIHYDIKNRRSWKDITENCESVDHVCHKVNDLNLYLSPIYSDSALAPHVYDRTAIKFLERLQDRFDLVLIDSSPAITSPDTIAVSRFTDGVVLVMEAERTSLHVMENLKNRIERNGGKILGVIFNKRKFYIPQPIYKCLH